MALMATAARSLSPAKVSNAADSVEAGGVHSLTIEGNRIIRKRLRGKRGRARPMRLIPALEKEEWAFRELEAKDWDQAATAKRKKKHWHNP